MRSPIRERLIWKLLAVQTVLVVGVLVAVWFAVDYLATDSFMTLMKKFQIDLADVEQMFRASIRTALVEVGAVAVLLAFGLSFWLTRRMLRPLDELTRVSERIAEGDYSPRIEPRRGVRDELDRVVAEFNRMAASLERMELVRKAMVVDVAHELRTPLTNLRGTIEALQDGLLAPDPGTLTALHDELLRLVRLTEDLLRAARTGVDGASARRVRVDLRALLDSTLELFQARLLRGGVTVTLCVEGLPESVRGDPDQLKQVFGNLLDNAIRFSRRGGDVKVSAVRRRGFVRIVFRNEGESIPADDLPWIFEPYYRVDRSRARDAEAVGSGAGGAGIGLAIVQSLVEAHGGRVGASSCAAATRVWVELPV